MFISFCALLIAVMALPSAASGARLNDAVMAGNWPWCVITSGSVVFSKCEKALSGTALAIKELVEPAEFAPPLDEEEEVGESAFAGGASVFADGVYSAEPVCAFEPAEDEPDAANDVEAPAPLAPDDALDWIYMWFSLLGSF